MTKHDPALSIPRRAARERLPLIRAFALPIVTLIGLYVCFLLALPFLPALAWALTLAVLAAPLHRRIENRLGSPSLSAAVSVSLLALLVIVPLSLVGLQLLAEVSSGAVAAQEQLTSAKLQPIIDSHPLLARAAAFLDGVDLPSIFGNLATWLTNLGASVLRGSLANLITVVLTFYLLFYFLRDRRDALHLARLLSPMTDRETARLFDRVSDTIHGVIFGTVVTAVVQGTLGGLMFWLLGLPNPLFWGFVMALLAVVPVLGAFVIWIPAAAFLALSGEWGKAAIMAGWGGIVISGIDNILHPMLAGGRLHLHTVPTFISMVGGLMLFGASGLILGPLAVITTITLLEVWRARSKGTSAEREGG